MVMFHVYPQHNPLLLQCDACKDSWPRRRARVTPHRHGARAARALPRAVPRARGHQAAAARQTR